MSLSDIVKLQRTLKGITYPSAVADIIKNQQFWETVISPTFENYLIVAANVELSSKYFKVFHAIDGKGKYIFPSIKLRNELANFYATKYEFYKISTDLVEKEEKQIEQFFVEETKTIKRIITDIYKNTDNLLQVDPRQFEEIIAELLHKKGFQVQLTKQTRDNGYDIIAIQNHDSFPVKFLVECKRYKTNKVGVEIVRSFKEVVQSQNANKGIIVTTSYFTKDAHQKRKETPYLLDYRDKDDVLSWVKEYCIK